MCRACCSTRLAAARHNFNKNIAQRHPTCNRDHSVWMAVRTLSQYIITTTYAICVEFAYTQSGTRSESTSVRATVIWINKSLCHRCVCGRDGDANGIYRVLRANRPNSIVSSHLMSHFLAADAATAVGFADRPSGRWSRAARGRLFGRNLFGAYL